ncbi:hypothetical protein F2P56_016660 [Juglans regia]|uniref:Cucumber peeling cupredoxin-like n=2 Tax=Juglans regia TaxID=51240 RepID=A0A2I4HWF0_JUGRE|nr:cucumber peeling cupredoxin-like [Juglans regia]KAF5466760.1 hypothetical protein F2P56_016660 [Juglans regia]
MHAYGHNLPALTYVYYIYDRYIICLSAFNFSTNEHDVLQIPKESYDSCCSANPIGETLTRSPVNITLSNAGNLYYICTFKQHCQSGQKFVISVSGSLDATPPTDRTPPSTKTPPRSSTRRRRRSTQNSSAHQAANEQFTGPTAQILPDSSSSGIFASFLVTLFSIVMGFLL